MKRLLFACAALIGLIDLISPASSQTVFNSYAAPTQVNPKAVSLTGTPGSPVTLYTGGARGSKCWGGMLNHNDQGTTHLVTFSRTLSGTAVSYASYTTAIGLAGNVLSTPVNIMQTPIIPAIFPVDQYGNMYFILKSGDLWQVNWATAVTGGDSIGITVECADFQ